MNYYDLAIARKSVRSFTAKKISDKTRSEIEDYGNRCECLTPGTAVEWRYLGGGDLGKVSGWAGYLGVVVGGPY